MKSVALIGYNYMGESFHAPLLDSSANLALRKVMTTKAERVMNLYPGVEILNDMNEVIHDADMVVFSDSPKLSINSIKAAILEKKDIVIDASLKFSLDDFLKLQRLALANNTIVKVFLKRRMDGDFLTLKNLITQKRIQGLKSLTSKIAYTHVEYQFLKENRDEDFFQLERLELIDQAVCLFGPPVGIMSHQSQDDKYPSFLILLKYDDFTVRLEGEVQEFEYFERFIIKDSRGTYIKEGIDPQESQLLKELNPTHEKFGSEDRSHFLFRSGEESETIHLHKGEYNKFYTNLAESIEFSEFILSREIYDLAINSSQNNQWVYLTNGFV